MAQPALPGTTKLRIKLKGLHTRAGCKGPAPAVKASFQLQDLRAAVAEFSTKGVNGLPGGLMMGAWNEEEVLQEQQYLMPSAPVATQHLEPRGTRVRKRRAAAASFDLVGKGLHYVVWGRSKRRRTQQPRRTPPAQLTDNLQRLLASGTRSSSQRLLATGTAPASGAAVEQQEPQQQQEPAPVAHHHQHQQEVPACVVHHHHHQQQQEQVAVQDALLNPQLKAVVQPVAKSQQVDQPDADGVSQTAAALPGAQPALVPAHKQQQQEAEAPMPQQHLPSDAQAQLAATDNMQDQQQQAAQVSSPHQPGDLQQVAAHQGEQALSAGDEQEGLLKSDLHAAKQSSGQQGGASAQPCQQEDIVPNSSSGGARGPVEGVEQQKQQQQGELEEKSAGIRESQGVEHRRQRVQKHKADALPASTPSAKKVRTSEQKAHVSAAAQGAAATNTPAGGRAVEGATGASSEPGKPEVAAATAAAAKAAVLKQAGRPDRAAGSANAAPAAVAKPDAVRQQALATKAPAGTVSASPTKPNQADKQAAAAKAAPSEAAPAAAAEPEPSPEVQAAAGAKPESPPSETSHQQPIAASVPQHMQKLQPPLQPLVPQMPQEQTAVSRDRSQCSLQQPAESPAAAASAGAGGAITAGSPASAAAAAAAAAMRGYSVHSGSGLAAGAPKRHLLELEASAMSPAALALGSMQVPTVSFRQVLPDRLFGSQEEALQYLDSMLVEARKKKHMGDNRSKQQNGWDVHSLTYYAYSALEFLRYWDACQRALKQLSEAGKPCEVMKKRTQSLTQMGLLKQVSHLCSTALQNASNCKGQDVQKQALRMLLERLCAICQLKHLHSQKEVLQHQANLLKGTITVPNSHHGGSSSKGQQQQQGQRAVSGKPPARAVAAATAAAAAVGANSGSSPHGKQAFDKRSPDDSNASNQDRVQLSGMLGPEQQSPSRVHGSSPGGHAAGNGAGAAGGGAASERMLMVAESTCAEHLGELLKITDGMHQTVMRMQQFLESPEVLADEDARAAALHISTLGLDAGMFSIPRVVAHAEAALVRVVRSGRRGMVRMAS